MPTSKKDEKLATTQLDVNEWLSLWNEITEVGTRATQAYVTHNVAKLNEEQTNDIGATKAFSEFAKHLFSNPEKLSEAASNYWKDQLELWQEWVTTSGEDAPTKTKKRDPRFRNELWDTWLFDYVKNAYFLAAGHLQDAVKNVDGLDESTSQKVKFFTKQYIDALSPTNFAATNPEVLQTTLQTGGRNLVDGYRNLLRDIARGEGQLAIKMVDPNAFELGKNVASTSGAVVFQNDLMQLIQYAPSTPKVNSTPLLIVPPWINKYYILDLRPDNSFIKWAIEQGHTVYVISWVNPDGKLGHKTFDDYLLEGPLAALDYIEKTNQVESTNVIGYCLGGTLTAVMLGWLRANNQAERVSSATFFTTMIDFENPGELGVFVDAEGIDTLEKKMATRGFLEGSEMASTFNLLRANDLIWSFVINNYLLGKEPMPFDLLFWNSDATRMPAKMHSFYLRQMYIHNRLREPGALEIAGARIDLSKVTTPTYFISTRDDHIAPWKSTFAGAKLFGGDTTFVLGGSGHIAGIVNPPTVEKYCHWTNAGLSHDANTWLETADETPGSWWPHWKNWVSKRAGKKVEARKLGANKQKIIEEAPGTYAKNRLDVAAKPKTASKPKSPKKTPTKRKSAKKTG